MVPKFYRKNFKFIANRYEEWQSGCCISRGYITTEIMAEVSGDKIHFELDDIGNIRMLKSFDFEIQGDGFCLLPDRIQYSHTTSDFNPIVPIVCHIFYTGSRLDYVRFAMTNPDRLIEFYGELAECGQPSTVVRHNMSNRMSASAEAILDELRGYGMENTDAIMERAVNLYNENSNCSSASQAKAIVESLRLFVEAYRMDEKAFDNEGEVSQLKPKILMFIALCNYKINNINRAYCIAKQGLDAIDDAIEASVFSNIPRSIYGEDTLNEIISIIETNHFEEVEDDDYDEVDPTEVDTDFLDSLLGNPKSKPQKQQIKLLIETISRIQQNFAKANERTGDPFKSFQLHQMFETFKMPLYFAWQGYKYGWHTDFCEEGDSLMPFMMFEADMKNNVSELINLLQTQSPFAQIERNSAITNALLSIYCSFLSDLEKGKFYF